MEDKVPSINMVVYLVANPAPDEKHKFPFFLGGCGYTYDATQEGKKKLAKNVATSTGYYTSNPQKPNTVVVVQDILNVVIPSCKTKMESTLSGFFQVLKLANEQQQKNLWVITPHKELEAVLKLKADAFEAEVVKLGRYELNPVERKLAVALLEQYSVIVADKERKVFFDFAGSAEGGMGNRDANKQLDMAGVITLYGDDKAPSIGLTSRKEYENPEVDFNRLAKGNSRWYFSTHEPELFRELKDGYRVYDFGRVEPDKNYYGKLTPDVTFGRLYTLKPMELLDKLFDFTVKRIANPDGYLSAGDLTQVVSKDVARLVDTIPGIRQKSQLVSPYVKNNGRSMLIELIKPVQMSYRIRDFFFGLDLIYEAFKNRDETDTSNTTRFYDITDEVLVKTVNGKGVTKLNLHPEFTTLKLVFKIKVDHPNARKPVPVTLSIGYDIPDRVAFNSIEDPNVKVWLVTDCRNRKGLRYCTLIQTDEFIYVNSGAGANLRVLTLDELGEEPK